MPVVKNHSACSWAARLRLSCGALLISLAAMHAAEPATLAKGWDQASSFLFNDATETFRKAPDTDPRQRAFGEAVSILNYQPQTAANTDFALSTFERLARENPSDIIGILSRYFVGRVNQFHLRPAKEEKAIAIYDELVKAKTGNSLAESSIGSLVLMRIYGDAAPADHLKTLAELEGYAPFLTTSAGQRVFHLDMAYAYLDFGGRDNKEMLSKALVHLQAAEAAGITRWQDEANLFLTTAEIAQQTGNNPLAIRYYQKFVQKYKRDSRNYYARKEVEKLTATAPAPTPAPAQP